MFGKRKKRGKLAIGRGVDGVEDAGAEEKLICVEFDRMLKGSLYERPEGTVRQCAVTVDGATKVVTSGDWIDQTTYRALLEAKALLPISDARPEDPGPPPPVGE